MSKLNDEYTAALIEWAEKDGTPHDLSRLLLNTGMRLTMMENALAEVVAAAKKQMENTGRGIEPSERLQEAYDRAERLMGDAT